MMVEHNFEAVKEAPLAPPELTENLGLNLTSTSFNDSFLQAKSNSFEPSMLPSAQSLLADLGFVQAGTLTEGTLLRESPPDKVSKAAGDALKDADRNGHKVPDGTHDDAHTRTLRESPPDKVSKTATDAIHDSKKHQNKIADDASKDPHIRRIEEIPTGMSKKVVTYDDVYTKTTYQPDGTIVAENAFGKWKKTTLPDGDSSNRKEIVETPDYVQTTYKNGTIVTQNRDGDTIVKAPDGTQTSNLSDGTVVTQKGHVRDIYPPNGTHVHLEPDGTETIEEPNGHRTVIKHGSWDAANKEQQARYKGPLSDEEMMKTRRRHAH